MFVLSFPLVLFYFQTKDTLVTDIIKIHNKQKIQTFPSHHIVFQLSLGEPPKCA